MINIKKLLVATILLVSHQFFSVQATEENKKYHRYNVEVFKTPSCGCCYGYVLFLEEEKFKVKQTDMRSLHTIKQKYNIPVEMQSCHTTIMGKYFIEGHVPFAVSYTHLRAHETCADLVCRLLLEKKK